MLELMTRDMEAVLEVERQIVAAPQVLLHTEHDFHAGVYSRTIMVPKGISIAGALIKIPTVLIVSGDIDIIIGHETTRVTGYALLKGRAGRKQAFTAHADTFLTMQFATTATTVAEAEEEFTDEFALLGSRREES